MLRQLPHTPSRWCSVVLVLSQRRMTRELVKLLLACPPVAGLHSEIKACGGMGRKGRKGTLACLCGVQ